jgi:hypothetical protein
MIYLILTFLAAALLVCGRLAYRIEAKRLPTKRARFADRENLNVEEIYERYFSDSGLKKEEVIDLWIKIAQTLHLEPGRLRPTDRFDAELAPVRGYLVEDELVDLEDLVRHHFQGRWQKSKAAKPCDLNQFINMLLHE